MTEAEIKAHVARGADEPMLRLAMRYAAQGMAFDCAWSPELLPRETRSTTKPTTPTAKETPMPTITYDTAGYRPRRASSVEQFQELRRAEAECAAYVPNALAMDSADEVYCAALDRMGVDTGELAQHRGAAAAVFRARRANGLTAVRPMTTAERKAFDERFPNARRLG